MTNTHRPLTPTATPANKQGMRESVHADDPLARAPHPLTTLTRQCFDRDVEAKHREIFNRFR